MPKILDALTAAPLLTDGATGSYLFELTGRPSEENHYYEALSIQAPDVVSTAHLAYLRAGAHCLTTNTFGAHRDKLRAVGLADQTTELNRAAVTIAREAIEAFAKRQGELGPFFVLGSVGPLANEELAAEEATEIYAEQIGALVEADVDAIHCETFARLTHLVAALDITHQCAPELPVFAQLALRRTGPEDRWNLDPRRCVHALAEHGANVVGINCCSPWDALAFVDAVADVPAVSEERVWLSALPNAGGLQRIDNRYMTIVNPEYMGKQARTLADHGVRLLGGCCEVHPPHIREMANYLRSRQRPTLDVDETPSATKSPAGPLDKVANGRFSQKLFNGKFAVSCELLPPRGSDPKLIDRRVDFLRELADSGLADAIDVTDGSRGIPLMPPGDFIQLARRRLGWEPDTPGALEAIPHFTSRDLNIMGIQSRLMGYHFADIHNVLFITGDPPKMSPTYPRSTAVFDVDSAGMIRFTQQCLNAGVDFGGRPLGKHDDPRTHFTVGAGFEPEALDLDVEQDKLRRKIDHGVDYIMTQPAFRFAPLDILEPFRDRVHILVGVLILRSYDHALRLNDVPGVTVPDAVLARLESYERQEDQAKAATEFAAEQVRWVREQTWAGLYLMSPASHKPVVDVLRQGLA